MIVFAVYWTQFLFIDFFISFYFIQIYSTPFLEKEEEVEIEKI